MYHSITFGDKNTWDDWHLVPSSRPLFNPPNVKTNFIEIPGYNGSLDLSESLTGFPVFDNRVGSNEFFVMNGYWEWYTAYSTIMNYIHGKKMKAVLEDDPEHYYIGRFYVNAWKSEKDYSKIVIDYNVDPFKYNVIDSIEDWKWDPFNFEKSIITSRIFKDIEINGSRTVIFTPDQYGYAPISPNFIVEGNIEVEFINEYMKVNRTTTLGPGTNFIPDIVMYGGPVTFIFTGEGKVSMDFHIGGL